jgi:hypothetical protein
LAAVRDCRIPLVEGPDRVLSVVSLGTDETLFRRANAEHPTVHVTSFVDLERPALVEMIEGNRAIDLSRWLSREDATLLEGYVPWPATCRRVAVQGCTLISTRPEERAIHKFRSQLRRDPGPPVWSRTPLSPG